MADQSKPGVLVFRVWFQYVRRRLTKRTALAKAVGSAYVEGYRLTFDQVSLDGSGKCDIEATASPADRVWGVIFQIAGAEAKALDEAKGLGQGCKKDVIDVIATDGVKTSTAYFAT